MRKNLLHVCCGPCFTAVNEKLSTSDTLFDIFWYNPNIEPKNEHDKRLETLLEYLKTVIGDKKVLYDYDYHAENKKWHEAISGLENEKEGGRRCERCFHFRLKRLLEFAKKDGYAFAATTLTVSPYKNATIINQIGKSLSKEIYLVSDFKEDDGYKRSIELSKANHLYRQKYCGCSYSQKPSVPSK